MYIDTTYWIMMFFAVFYDSVQTLTIDYAQTTQ